MTNAHRHTRSRQIRVEALVNRKQTTVYFCDSNPWRLPVPGEAGLGAVQEGGQGLRLVESLARAWGLTIYGCCRPRVQGRLVHPRPRGRQQVPSREAPRVGLRPRRRRPCRPRRGAGPCRVRIRVGRAPRRPRRPGGVRERIKRQLIRHVLKPWSSHEYRSRRP
ncbi:ATP-binding protein [Streptomyces sp. S4.7]|uniref:ATP-binding protein n=1 Tax=Streptomyces sp. S4.7 TaxID=2705439 RepID=UPI0031BA504F